MKSEFRSRQLRLEHDSAADIIEFSLPENARITLQILDANGSTVRQVVESVEYPAGTHVIRCGGMKNGDERLYYRLTAKTLQWEIVDTKMISNQKEKT